MDKSEILELKKTACNVRLWTVEGVFNAKSGHPGGSLCCRYYDLPLFQGNEG